MKLGGEEVIDVLPFAELLRLLTGYRRTEDFGGRPDGGEICHYGELLGGSESPAEVGSSKLRASWYGRTR